MALNKTIIQKVGGKTKSEPEVRKFLVDLLKFESEIPGWWTTPYNTYLEKNCKEDKKDENN